MGGRNEAATSGLRAKFVGDILPAEALKKPSKGVMLFLESRIPRHLS